MSKKVFEIITSQILALLEKGEIPWRKPWGGKAGNGFRDGFPMNAWGKPYRGMNVWLLRAVQQFNGWECNQWATSRQINRWGGKFLDEKPKSTQVIHCQPVYEEEEVEKDGKLVKRKRLKFWSTRYFNVYNLEQTDLFEDWKAKKLKALEEAEEADKTWDSIEACEEVLKAYVDCPVIGHGGGRAYYSPSDDRIQMPVKHDFHSKEEYYCTLFHELAHSTGAESRLARKGVVEFDMFGSHQYSQEELVAELTSAFLCGYTGISQATIENSAGYIQSWSKKLRDNPSWFHFASLQAQKAFEYIMGDLMPSDDEEAEEATE